MPRTLSSVTVYCASFALGFALLGCADQNASTRQVDLTPEQQQTATNKALATTAMTGLMIDKNPSIVDQYWSANYIQHSPIQPAGRAPIEQWVATLPANTQFKYQMGRVLAEGDLVAFQGRVEGFMAQPVIMLNLFRVQDGKLAEHWEGIQIESGPNPNGHTMFDGATAMTDLDKTESNRQVVSGFINSVLIQGNLATLEQFISPMQYIQHNPQIADGITGIRSGFQALADAGILIRYSKVHRLIAEGNFVLSHSEGTFGGKATQFFDIFRLENGKIVEHWDVIQDISNGSLNNNGVF
ncbi:nuclear transport factor 2 family protein [Neisseriaceae bacterium TC5R-5]|nr:nuclear transport factor 2 family protein [Neisseriaceae bacterium TC5R-5]